MLYQKLVPEVNGAANFNVLYMVFIINNSINNGAVLTLKAIEIVIPGNSATLIERNVDCGKFPVVVRMLYSEAIRFSGQPAIINIKLHFLELSHPVSYLRNLAPHGTSYPFMMKPEDFNKFGQYLRLPAEHSGSSPDEFYAHDVKALGWVNGKLETSKGPTSEDHFIYGRPIYSLGKGRVLLAEDSHADHPAPGLSGVRRKDGFWQSLGVSGRVIRVILDRVPHGV